MRYLAASGLLALAACGISEKDHLDELVTKYDAQQRAQSAEEAAIEEKHGLLLLGEHTLADARAIDRLLDRLTKTLIDPTERLYLIPRDALHTASIRSLAEAHSTGYAACAGHGHGVLDDDSIVHELAHILHFKLQRDDTFDNRWQAILDKHGVKYGVRDGTWEDGYKGPRKGFARSYGATNRYEDVATMVEEVYAMSYNKNYELGKCIIPWLVVAAPEDKPLLEAKLDLLLEYGFVTAADYEYAKAHLGSAHAQYKQFLTDLFYKIFENPFGSRTADN